MARSLRRGSKEEKARAGLSDFQIAVREAAFFKSPRRLASFVRDNHQMTAADREMLAEFIERKLKRGRGRPEGKRMLRNDWKERAAWDFYDGIQNWKNNGGKNKIVIKGVKVSFRDNLIERLEQKYRPHGDYDSLANFLDSRRKRRK